MKCTPVIFNMLTDTVHLVVSCNSAGDAFFVQHSRITSSSYGEGNIFFQQCGWSISAKRFILLS